MWEWRFFVTKVCDFETIEEVLNLHLSPISFETRIDNYFDLNLRYYGLKERNSQTRRNVFLELKSLRKEEDHCEYWIKRFKKPLSAAFPSYNLKEVLLAIENSTSDSKALADIEAVRKTIENQKVREINLKKSQRKLMARNRINIEFEKSTIEYKGSHWYTFAMESNNLNSIRKYIPRLLNIDKKVMGYPEFIRTLH